jgi:hypothetical protein
MKLKKFFSIFILVNHNKELDYILKRLLDFHSKEGERRLLEKLGEQEDKPKYKITEEIKEKHKTEIYVIHLLFEELISKGHVKRKPELEITFQGRVFILNGGYTTKRRREVSKWIWRAFSALLMLASTVAIAVYTAFQYHKPDPNKFHEELSKSLIEVIQKNTQKYKPIIILKTDSLCKLQQSKKKVNQKKKK